MPPNCCALSHQLRHTQAGQSKVFISTVFILSTKERLCASLTDSPVFAHFLLPQELDCMTDPTCVWLSQCRQIYLWVFICPCSDSQTNCRGFFLHNSIVIFWFRRKSLCWELLGAKNIRKCSWGSRLTVCCPFCPENYCFFFIVQGKRAVLKG